MKIGDVLVVVLALAAASGVAAAASWTEVDAGLPRSPAAVRAVVIDPSSPATVYALGRDLFKSTDAGETWQMLGGVSRVSALAIDPGDSSLLYAVAHGTVLKSRDGGQTWSSTGFGLISASALAIDPQNTATLYAVTFNGIFKSTDAGATWTENARAFPAEFAVTTLTIDPTDSSTMYATGTGIYKTIDGGESWRELSSQKGGFCGCPVAIDPAHPSTVYARLLRFDKPGVGGNLFRLSKSTDGGETWDLADAGIPGFVTSLAFGPGSTIYASYIAGDPTGGVVKSTDGGANWTAVNNGLPANTPPINSLAVNPARPSTIFAGYFDFDSGNGGVFRTVDGAASWTDSGAALTAFDVHALGVDPGSPDTVYAAGSGGVSRSSDGGAAWKTVSLPSPGRGTAVVLSLLIDAHNPQVLYAAVEGSAGCSFTDGFLRKSADGGETWKDLAVKNCVFGSTVSLAMDPADSNTIYAAAEDTAACGTPLDITADGGTTWNEIYISGFVTALAVDRSDRATLYAGTSWWPGGLLKSTDGGKTWGKTGLADGDVSVLAVDPVNQGVLYAGIAQPFPDGTPGLVKSTDGGVTWSPINTGLGAIIGPRTPVTALVMDPRNSTLYLGTAGGGVFRSGDGGANWGPFNDGLPSLAVQALAVSSDGSGTVYAGTSGGVFRAIDDPQLR